MIEVDPTKQQQGDVIFTSALIPKGAKKVDRTVLVEGEATGHAHRLRRGDEVDVYENGGQLFLKVKNALLTHEEHGTQTLIEGDREVRRIQEFDPLAEVMREVAD